MRAIDIVKSIVVQHNRWSKTECPRIIRSKGLWDKFLLDISVGLHDMLNPKKLIDEDLKNALDILVSYKQLQSPEYWLENAVEGSTVKGEFVNIILKRWSNMFKNVMDMENKKELDRVQVRKIVKY
jgi:N-acetylmuramoyl-L-alanine amidase